MGSNPYLGQLTGFAGNFAPRGWSYCNGALLPIAQNSALFSLLGTMYGGDGRTTFGLPDLRGRAPIGEGNGPGLSSYTQGQKGGAERVTLVVSQIPSHNHQHQGTSKDENLTPVNNLADESPTFSNSNPSVQMNNGIIKPTGGGQSHENMPPVQTINWIIALVGVFPSRS